MECIVMPRLARRVWLPACVLLFFGGCAENSFVMKGQLDKFQQQQTALTKQNQQLQDRATALDRDNQELLAQLAQTKQQAKVLDDQLAAVREQLRGVTAQLAQIKTEKGSSDKKIDALTASLRRQGGVSITPNNSFLQTLPALDLPTGHVRRDGDVIRVALPGKELFEPGGARLRPNGINLVVTAANELLRIYPNQIIGVEGYSDTDTVTGGQYRSSHELSAARALAVYDVLVTRSRLQPNQLFVAGHGPNQPMVSNATAEGKETNRRVELVVYPEKRE
jgi:flagellar motor protein MotB